MQYRNVKDVCELIALSVRILVTILKQPNVWDPNQKSLFELCVCVKKQIWVIYLHETLLLSNIDIVSALKIYKSSSRLNAFYSSKIYSHLFTERLQCVYVLCYSPVWAD